MTKPSSTHKTRNAALALTLSLFAPTLAGLSACGAEQGTTEAAEEALTIPPGDPIFEQCLGKSPDATGTRRTFTTLHAPTHYGTSGCPKAYVIDAAPPATSIDEQTELDWSDPWDRSEVQCKGGKLKLVLMSKAPGEVLARTDGTFEAPLRWDAGQQRCLYTRFSVQHHLVRPGVYDQETWKVLTLQQGTGSAPWLVIDSKSVANFNGRTLRFVASALTPAGSTQPMLLSLY
jgi:hypothetical protein